MSVSLIRLDGRIIGAAPAPGDDQGIGVLAWFHENKRAYSMDHATRYEGYSVDAPGEIDCHDVESIIVAICERAGVTLDSVFVPFSQSRNAKAEDGKPWESLNWRVTLKRNGREVLTTDYAQGVAYAPASKKTAAQIETAALLERAYDARIDGRGDEPGPGDYTAEQAGRDYWFTRNGHGVGFWDSDLGDVGDLLSNAAGRTEINPYWTDDGRVSL